MQYTPSHEWIRLDKDIGTVGITLYAVKELGEIVHIQLPSIGTHLIQGEEAVVLESTKAAADIYSPVSGVVVAVNEKLLEDLSLLNETPESAGWLFQVELDGSALGQELLTQEEYLSMIRP